MTLPAAFDASALGRMLDGGGQNQNQKLLIIVNDPQRDTNSRCILKAIADEIDLSNARILIAAGSHRFAEPDRRAFEADLTLGLAVGEIAWHDSKADDLVSIAGQWQGHRWLGSPAGAILAIGSVEPHYFAGYSGCHKTATIGVASYADIQTNHAGAISSAARGGKLKNNPVHDGIIEMLRALQSARPVIGVNTVQPGGKIVAINFGDPLTALESSIPTAREHFSQTFKSPADAIIAEVSGALGKSFYQADKGIKNNEWALADGGVFILVAPCDDGIGQDNFLNILKSSTTHAQALQAVSAAGYSLGDHKAVRLRYLTDKSCRAVKLFIVSKSLPASLGKILDAQIHPTLASAIEASGIDQPSNRVRHIKDAGNVCLSVEL
ncbi:MAG TPA: DUF2088 domain-containing protein [Phycisphaerae bacterium]|nr:DUF2088 domain-containing protein [Phycisphaerae bacterium]